ncbi:aldehyde dehydrogenase family protein [Robertmurraya massiliosenegalensis]|uniref:aldehyde dehydrogenase family protein n=1 Tax=Robertmurraya TaxID=2837507 RepID=UPI0039A523CB
MNRYEEKMKDYHENKVRVQKLLNRPWEMLINGEFVSAKSGQTIETYNPATQELLATVPFAQNEDIEDAYHAAFEAFEKWRNVPVTERVKFIYRIIDILKEHKEDLALIDALNSGNPLQGMLKDVDIACDSMAYLAGTALDVKGQTFPSTEGNWHFTTREPYGVVARIVPYNHPLMFAATKIVAPIVMGNTVILKAPDQDPLACMYFAELINKILPAGVINIITGDGPITGNALVQHPHIKRISLIGSVSTGMRIQEAAAQTAVKHISLELGGKNPMIVFPDADIDGAVDGVFNGMNFCSVQGQSCGSTSRLFIHEYIHDEFVQKLIAKMESNIKLGMPIDPSTTMGCLVSKSQYDKVNYYISLGKEEGAKLIYGGHHPSLPELKNGYFVEPTIFDGVDSSMRIAQEEVFGPVLSIIKWNEEEEVLNQANSTEFGLTASLWTNDIKKAVRFSREIQSGVIWINQSSRHYVGLPFSGYKNSGLDSEESIEELYSYTQIKTVNVIVD